MNKCGLVYLDDLTNHRRQKIHNDMTKFSKFFQTDAESWWPDLPWPRDPLSQWSRQFEYPYCWWHCLNTRERGHRILDAGSGITFFPFYMAMQGWDVSCTDRDPRLSGAFRQVNDSVPESLRVEFAESDLSSLGYRRDSFSHVMCISVLEHIPEPQLGIVLDEFSRVIAPGGILILTIDVSLREDSDAVVRMSNLGDFITILKEKGFVPSFKVDDQISPERLLTTDYFLNTHPQQLPWVLRPDASTNERIRHWARTVLLRRDPFQSLGLAVFVCRSLK